MAKAGYLNFYIEPEELQRLRVVAQVKGFTLSEMARKCLRVGLKHADDFLPKQTDHMASMTPTVGESVPVPDEVV